MAEAVDFQPEAEAIDFQAEQEPTPGPPVSLSPYEQARMQGVGPGLGATTGPAAPETVLPFYQSLTQPAVNLPRLRPRNPFLKVLAAPVNVVESLAEGAISPVGALTLPAFGTPVGRAAMAALGTVQGLQQIGRAKDVGELAEGAVLAGISPSIARRRAETLPAPVSAPETTPEPLPPVQAPETPPGPVSATPEAVPEPPATPVSRVAVKMLDYGKRRVEKRVGDKMDDENSDDLAFPRVPVTDEISLEEAQSLNPNAKAGELIVTDVMRNGDLQVARIKDSLEQSPEKIVSAAFRTPEGAIETGANHPAILKRLGIKGFDSPESRNTPQFGFVTDKGRFVSREEAGPLSEASGQNLKDFEPDEPVHSDEVASPVEPDKPLGNVPRRIEDTIVAGKTLGEWEAVKDAKELPKGKDRAALAKWLAVPNQPARILGALGNKRRTREIHAPPAAIVPSQFKQQVTDIYNQFQSGEGNLTERDLMGRVNDLISETDESVPAGLQQATEDYEDAIIEDFKMHGRGDVEPAEEAFMRELGKFVGEQPEPPRSETPPATVATPELPAPPTHPAASEAPTALATPVEAPAAAAFKQRLFQGKGASAEQVYGPEAVSEGRAVPILGKGDYYAFSKEDAKVYGKVTEHEVELQNPLRIDSDRAWIDLLNEAGTQVLNSRGKEFYTNPERIPAATERLQAYIKSRGHDGVVIDLPEGDVNAKGERVKGLAESFGHSQVVKFANEPGPGHIGMGGAALGEIQPTGPRGEPTHGIAARVLEQRRQQGVIAPVEPGQGIAPEESVERGRALLAAGANPEQVLADFARTKAVSADGIAIVRAEGERLARAAYAAADTYGVNSPQYEAAWEADSAWAKATKPLQTEWHKIGQAQQGETEIDTGTFHGLRHAFFEATGRDFTPQQAADAVEVARTVKEATEAEDKAKAEVFAQVGKEAATAAPRAPTKPGEVAVPSATTLWKRAKAMIDAGEDDFDALRHKLAQEFGIPVDDVTRMLGESKTVKKLSDDMYRKMSDRRRLVNQAKNWLKNEQIPGWLNFTRKVPRVFFTAKILGHGTVGMITHAGLNMFNPGAWRHYWPAFFQQYRLLASKAYYERMMQDLLRDPGYTRARRAGLLNDALRYQDDYATPVLIKWLDRIGLTGNRGFDALKLFRQARFNQIWDALPQSLQTPEYAKVIADSVNHATGGTRRLFREWANWTFFAPRLEASRWAWAVKDPWDAAKIFVDWQKATPEQKAFALSQLKEKAAIAGTYYTLLLMNQGLLSASGSDQNINFTNPRRGDFLAFKAAGHNIGIVGPMLGMVRLFANLAHAAAGKRGKVESLEPRAAEFGQIGFEYARGKLSPFAGFGVDVISQADFQGRPMPYSKDAVPKYLRDQGLGRYTYGEYAAQEFTPIPVSEAIREVWHDQGMNDDEINAWLKALAVGVASGSTGARVSPETPQRKTK